MLEADFKITIIVPFYNAESHIEFFIWQLKKQNCQNFQAIFIDDGSSDGSVELFKKNTQGGDNNKYILLSNKEQRCVGAARALGIKFCSSKYFTFFDIDDKVSPDAVQIILSEINNCSDTDIFIFDHRIYNMEKKETLISSETSDYIELFKSNSLLLSHLWNKVFRTNLFREIDMDFFSTLSFAEDLYACIHAILLTNRIKLIHKSYYTYIIHDGTCVTARSEKSFFDNVKVNIKLLDMVNTVKNESIESYIQRDSFNCFGQFIFPNKKNAFQWKQPHFSQYRELPLDKVVTPKGVSSPARFYIYLIKHRCDFFAFIIWILLKAKRGLKNG